jgi:hypothetical protein
MDQSTNILEVIREGATLRKKDCRAHTPGIVFGATAVKAAIPIPSLPQVAVEEPVAMMIKAS